MTSRVLEAAKECGIGFNDSEGLVICSKAELEAFAALIAQEARTEQLKPARDVYARLKAAERQATWGGSFEKEEGARRQLPSIGKELWMALLPILDADAIAAQAGGKGEEDAR